VTKTHRVAVRLFDRKVHSAGSQDVTGHARFSWRRVAFETAWWQSRRAIKAEERRIFVDPGEDAAAQ